MHKKPVGLYVHGPGEEPPGNEADVVGTLHRRPHHTRHPVAEISQKTAGLKIHFHYNFQNSFGISAYKEGSILGKPIYKGSAQVTVYLFKLS